MPPMCSPTPTRTQTLFCRQRKQPAVSAVNNCRLPSLWRGDPELWFLQVKSAFQVHQVRHSPTRYHLVVAALDPKTIFEVADDFRNPPANEGVGQKTFTTTLRHAITDQRWEPICKSSRQNRRLRSTRYNRRYSTQTTVARPTFPSPAPSVDLAQERTFGRRSVTLNLGLR